MRKNFILTATKHKADRQVELVKSEINKYVARERRLVNLCDVHGRRIY